MKVSRIAVVGAGHLGRIHSRLARAGGLFELVAVADPVPEACAAVSAEVGCPGVADWQQLVGQIDAAIVATPTRLHFEIAAELLRHGIHLLVEKPLCTSAREAEELVALAKEHGHVLQVGHVERFNPAWIAVVGKLNQQPQLIHATRTCAR